MVGIKGKGPVYRLDRLEKARMIEAVLEESLGRKVVGLNILDIGCGNGDISQYLSCNNTQLAVDIADRRRPENRGFEFQTVNSEILPYPNCHFDIVISHHVIEHVTNQSLHLSEVLRVLKLSGRAYLATPNRSSPIMQGHKGNDCVLRYAHMSPMFEGAGFRVAEFSVALLHEPHRFHSEVRFLGWMPQWLLKSLRPLFPSHVFVLMPAVSCDSLNEQNDA